MEIKNQAELECYFVLESDIKILRNNIERLLTLCTVDVRLNLGLELGEERH